VCAVCVLRDLGCVLVLDAVLEALSLNLVYMHSIDVSYSVYPKWGLCEKNLVAQKIVVKYLQK